MENPFDLRAFLAKIDAAGQLRTINGAALDTEVGALTELNGQRQGPALLFGGFEGYPAGYRVLSGAMLNAATFGAALGAYYDVFRLLRLFVCLCVVTFAFLFVVIFDLMNPSIGFFRG